MWKGKTRRRRSKEKKNFREPKGVELAEQGGRRKVVGNLKGD